MAEKNKNQMNINVDHTEHAFYSDGFTISHRPNKFIFDFTQSVPKFDVVNGKMHQTVCVKHKTIVMDPALAKDFMKRMHDNMGKYEKNFEKIKLKKGRKRKPPVSTVTTPQVKKAETRYIG